MTTHIDIDLSGAMDPNAPAPDGTYDLQCMEAEFTKSQAGNDMVKSTWEIQGGEYAGKTVWENWVLSGDGKRFGQWRFRQALEACGGDPTHPDVEVMVGKTIRALIGTQISTDPQYGDKNVIRNILT